MLLASSYLPKRLSVKSVGQGLFLAAKCESTLAASECSRLLWGRHATSLLVERVEKATDNTPARWLLLPQWRCLRAIRPVAGLAQTATPSRAIRHSVGRKWVINTRDCGSVAIRTPAAAARCSQKSLNRLLDETQL